MIAVGSTSPLTTLVLFVVVCGLLVFAGWVERDRADRDWFE